VKPAAHFSRQSLIGTKTLRREKDLVKRSNKSLYCQSKLTKKRKRIPPGEKHCKNKNQNNCGN
jgi:hypothetical protein